jgi:hypothetical protein
MTKHTGVFLSASEDAGPLAMAMADLAHWLASKKWDFFRAFGKIVVAKQGRDFTL